MSGLLRTARDVMPLLLLVVSVLGSIIGAFLMGSFFIMSISAWYLLKGRDLAFARRAFAEAAGFGLASVLSVITLGDESGYDADAGEKAT